VNDSLKPPLTTTTSILPAMAVVGVAAVTLIVFLIINIVASPRVTGPSASTPIVVGGLGVSASAVLSGCRQPGTPPSNIAGALLVPVTTRATGATVHANGGAGDYDCLRALATSAPASRLLGFYSSQLQARGWDLFSTSTNGRSQLLFQKAGSDTFYWIVGITINRVRGATSYWTYRIYQNSSTI
jgi:hypothetical protein